MPKFRCVLSKLILAERSKILAGAVANEEWSEDYIEYLSIVTIYSSIRFHPVYFSLFITDNADHLFKGVESFNITADCTLKSGEQFGELFRDIGVSLAVAELFDSGFLVLGAGVGDADLFCPAINKQTTNICSFFLDKVQKLGKQVAVVFPKFILNTPEFSTTRQYLSQKAIPAIIDFGEKGFPGVLIETIALFIDNTRKPKNTIVRSATDRLEMIQAQKYIFDDSLPYWIIYRDEDFDAVKDKLQLGVFDVFRDRQLTNSMFSDNKQGIRVIKARNISDDGSEILEIDGYDAYISQEKAEPLGVFKFLNADNVYLTPNMTYYPRVIRKPKNTLVNGSVAILVPKQGMVLTNEQLRFFSTKEYRNFYWTARNHQTRSLNVDSCSVYFFGVKR